MFYESLSNEELQKYPYPNLIAELIESGYSICTLGTHMDLGEHCEEDEPEVWARLSGKQEITTDEAFSLCGLFGVNLDYLFSHDLRVLNGEPLARIRWYESNQRRKRDAEISELWYQIRREMKEKPYLYEFMKEVISCNAEQIQVAMRGLYEARGLIKPDIQSP